MLNEIDFNVMAPEYRLYLCKPDKTTISELVIAYNIQLSMNYGGIHQLSFKLPYREKRDMKYVRSLAVDITNGDYLIRLERGSEINYFIITQYINNYSDGNETMEVECNFLPYELSYKVVHFYQEIKPLYDFIGTDSILHDTLLLLSDWTVDYCNAEVGIQYRSIDVSQTDLLSFLNQLSSTFNIILVFDSVNKTVSFYKEEEYGTDTGVVLDDNSIKSLQQTQQYSEIITKLYCYGNDGLDFSDIDPNGNTFVEDLSFYMYPYEEDGNGLVIKHSHYMSDGLCHTIMVHNTLVENNKVNFANMSTQKEVLVNSLVPFKSTEGQLKAEMDLINKSIDINIKNGLSITALNDDKAAKQILINNNQSSMNTINGQITTLDLQIDNLISLLAIENNFTAPQIKERNNYIREKVWTDTQYVSSEDLYKDGIARLKSVSQPILAYEVDAIDLISQLNDYKDWNRIQIGSVVTVRFPDFGVEPIKAKIITIEHGVDEHSFKITIANQKSIHSGFLKLADLLSKSITTSSTVDFQKNNWAQGAEANNIVSNYINNALDMTKQQLIAGNNNCVQMDERGLTISDNSNSNKVLRLTNGVMAFSSDGQQTFKTAISTKGIVADSLVGHFIASEDLLVSNTSGTFSVNGNGVTISGATLTITGKLPDSEISSASAWSSGVTTANSAWDKFSGNGNTLPSGNVEFNFATSTTKGGNASNTDAVGTQTATKVQSATINFNSRNDRNPITPANPLVLADGTAIDHVINTDSTATISFEWSFNGTGNPYDIDGFIVFVYQASVTTPYIFGTDSSNESVYYVTPERRAFVLPSVTSNKYYTFGIQAYRIVDQDINSTGSIKSSIVKSTLVEENPYQPSALVAFAGNISGTINGISASTVANQAGNSVQQGASYDNVVINTSGIKVTQTNSSNLISQTILNSSGFKIQKNIGSNSVPNWSTTLSTDTSGNLSMTGNINATSGTFSGNITATGKITGGTFETSGITGATISGSTLSIGNTPNIIKFDPAFGLWAGADTYLNAPFKVSLLGAVTASSLSAPNLTISSGKVSGLGTLATQNSVDYNNLTGSKPPYNADRTQTTIDGGIITSGTIMVGTTGYINAGMTGSSTQGSASIRFWAGSPSPGTNSPFYVTDGGKVKATNISIEGNESTISIGGSATIGKTLYLGDQSNSVGGKSIYFNGTANISNMSDNINGFSALSISAQKIKLGSRIDMSYNASIDMTFTNIDFSNSVITGLSAKFG